MDLLLPFKIAALAVTTLLLLFGSIVVPVNVYELIMKRCNFVLYSILYDLHYVGYFIIKTNIATIVPNL